MWMSTYLCVVEILGIRGQENPAGATVVEGMFWNPPSLITSPLCLIYFFMKVT